METRHDSLLQQWALLVAVPSSCDGGSRTSDLKGHFRIYRGTGRFAPFAGRFIPRRP